MNLSPNMGSSGKFVLFIALADTPIVSGQALWRVVTMACWHQAGLSPQALGMARPRAALLLEKLNGWSRPLSSMRRSGTGHSKCLWGQSGLVPASHRHNPPQRLARDYWGIGQCYKKYKLPG